MVKSLDYGEPGHQPSRADNDLQVKVLYPMVRSQWRITLKAACKVIVLPFSYAPIRFLKLICLVSTGRLHWRARAESYEHDGFSSSSQYSLYDLQNRQGSTI